MKVIAHYRGIHFDNYQGGSGKNYENKAIVDIDESNTMSMIKTIAESKINDITKNDPFYDNIKVYLIEIVDVL